MINNAELISGTKQEQNNNNHPLSHVFVFVVFSQLIPPDSYHLYLDEYIMPIPKVMMTGTSIKLR
jgi:hypothetical protein